MEQAEIDKMLQSVKKYDAEKYLVEAVKLLRHIKKIDINIVDCEWLIILNKPILKIIYSIGSRTVTLRAAESLFKEYQKKVDTRIGIKPEMKMEHKIILRLAYLLYTHRDD